MCLMLMAFSTLQLAQQFVACIHFVNKRHDLELLSEADKIRDVKNEQEEKPGRLLTLSDTLEPCLLTCCLHDS